MNLANLNPQRNILKTLIFSCLLAVLSFMNMPQSWAHAHLVKTTPEANATVESVAQVCIEFDSKLESAFSKLNLFNEQGQQVNMDEATFDKDDKEICLVAPDLEPGTYNAEWIAVARDGHQVNGDYKFSVK